MASSWLGLEMNKNQLECTSSSIDDMICSQTNQNNSIHLIKNENTSQRKGKEDGVSQNSATLVDGVVTENENQLATCGGDSDCGMQEISYSLSDDTDINSLRKSERERRERRTYSPDCLKSLSKANMKKRGKKLTKKSSPSKPPAVRPYDKGPDGEPFSCDLCKSRYVCNPSRKGNQIRRSKHQPTPRYKRDMQTGKVLMLCNACGLAFDRPRRPRKEKNLPSQEEREIYFEEARNFSVSLTEQLQDPDAERLWCPYFKIKSCGCLQRYIIGSGESEDSEKRARQLLALIKEAKELSKQKCYNVEELFRKTTGKTKKSKNIGLGNGQKKSKDFEEFVMKNRKYLRQDLKLCERGAQRVLHYSNNFLHKRLKTEERLFRAERVKGKAALGLLKAISDLPFEKCCVDNCVMMALTHGRLLQHWRSRAVSGQVEARRVLAEMLTPSGGARSNCYKFICWVTGCSHSTIGRVNEQMRNTGGDREPPEHGLKKYWMKKPRKEKEGSCSDKEEEFQNAGKETNSHQLSDKENGSSAQVILQQLSNCKVDMVPMVTASSDQPAEAGGTQVTLHSVNSEDAEVVTLVQSNNGGLQEVQVTTNQSEATPVQDYQCVLDVTPIHSQLHKQQLLQLHGQLHQEQLRIQQKQQLIQQYLMHHLLLEHSSASTNPAQHTIMNPNVQQATAVIEHQPVQQIHHHMQPSVIQVQHVHQPVQSVQMQPDTTKPTSQQNASSKFPKHTEKQALIQQAEPQSRQLPVSSTVNQCVANNTVTANAQTIVQQILDVPHIGGSTVCTLPSTQPQMSNIFTQLSDYSNMIAPNVNIATIHQAQSSQNPHTPQIATAAGMESDSDSQPSSENNGTHILQVQNIGTLHIPVSMLNQHPHANAPPQNIRVSLAEPSLHVDSANVIRVHDVIIEEARQPQTDRVVDSVDDSSPLSDEVLRLLSQQGIQMSTIHKDT